MMGHNRSDIRLMCLRLFVVNLAITLSFLYRGNVLRASEADLHIDADTCAVMTIKGEGNTLWFGTTKGLFKWEGAPSGKPQQVRVDVGTVYVLLQDKGTLWIGSERGLLRWDNPAGGGNPKFVPGAPASITKLQRLGSRLLIGGEGGLFVWQEDFPGSVTPYKEAGRFVNALLQDGKRVWVGTDSGLFRWDSESETPVPVPLDRNVEVTYLAKSGLTLLVGTTAGLLRWDDTPDGSRAWILNDVKVYSIYIDGEAVLISTQDSGLLRFQDVRADHYKKIEGLSGTSSRYYRNGSLLWMGAGYTADAGLYKWDTENEGKPKRLEKINTGYVSTFYRDGDILWIGAQNGLFRIEGLSTKWEDADLQFTSPIPKNLNTDSTARISWRVGKFGWRTTPQQAQYRVVITDATGHEIKLEGLETTGTPDISLPPLPEGEYKLYVQATDLNGKIAQSNIIQFPVYASWKAVLSRWVPWTALTYAVLIILVIILSPHSNLAHEMLMNPWLRKYGSFGLIPLALTLVRPARSHVLKRYLEGVRGDKDFTEWQKRFVIPADNFSPESFSSELSEQRRVLLQGQSGVGKTSYFRYLTGYYVRRTVALPQEPVPVYIPLNRHRSETPEDMFSAQLSNYGLLTDKKLNWRFLEQGGFVIFLDGLNEIDEATRDKVFAFVEAHWKANYFCLSSQHPHDELSGIKQVRLSPLTEDKIHDLLRLRVGREQAEEIIKQFGGNLSKVYAIPQDLELAVAFKRRNPKLPIPASKLDLYEATFSPLLEAWVGEGRTDYPEMLFHRAYEMLRSGDPFFNDTDSTLPEDLTHPLLENKYLIQRGGDHYMFRHDLVRSYLASKYFRPNWRDLLFAAELELGSGWDRMLEFSILSTSQPEEARELLKGILGKNKHLAGSLFSWMEKATPDLIEGWASKFKLQYAEAMLPTQ